MTPIRSEDPVLIIALKGEYYDAIEDGSKIHEFRLTKPYWRRRLEGRSYSAVELTRGYPAADDTSRRMRRAWKGFDIRKITHPHFGPAEVEVFAIDVSEPI